MNGFPIRKGSLLNFEKYKFVKKRVLLIGHEVTNIGLLTSTENVNIVL